MIVQRRSRLFPVICTLCLFVLTTNSQGASDAKAVIHDKELIKEIVRNDFISKVFTLPEIVMKGIEVAPNAPEDVRINHNVFMYKLEGYRDEHTIRWKNNNNTLELTIDEIEMVPEDDRCYYSALLKYHVREVNNGGFLRWNRRGSVVYWYDNRQKRWCSTLDMLTAGAWSAFTGGEFAHSTFDVQFHPEEAIGYYIYARVLEKFHADVYQHPSEIVSSLSECARNPYSLERDLVNVYLYGAADAICLLFRGMTCSLAGNQDYKILPPSYYMGPPNGPPRSEVLVVLFDKRNWRMVIGVKGEKGQGPRNPEITVKTLQLPKDIPTDVPTTVPKGTAVGDWRLGERSPIATLKYGAYRIDKKKNEIVEHYEVFIPYLLDVEHSRISAIGFWIRGKDRKVRFVPVRWRESNLFVDREGKPEGTRGP